MARAKDLLMEVAVLVDEDEVDTPEKLEAKKRQLRRAIESLDPMLGIFTVERID